MAEPGRSITGADQSAITHDDPASSISSVELTNSPSRRPDHTAVHVIELSVPAVEDEGPTSTPNRESPPAPPPVVLVIEDGTGNRGTPVVEPNDEEGRGSFKLAIIFLGLAFEASTGLYQARVNSPSSSSSSIPSTMAGVSVLSGFTFTGMGLSLRRLHPEVADRFSNLGIISTALGFFFMMHTYLPESYGWFVWVAAGLLLAVYVYSRIRESE